MEIDLGQEYVQSGIGYTTLCEPFQASTHVRLQHNWMRECTGKVQIVDRNNDDPAVLES